MGRSAQGGKGAGEQVPQGYLQGRHVVGQLDRDGRLHVQDVVVPEKIPQLLLVLVDHLDHPGQGAGASAPILAIPQERVSLRPVCPVLALDP